MVGEDSIKFCAPVAVRGLVLALVKMLFDTSNFCSFISSSSLFGFGFQSFQVSLPLGRLQPCCSVRRIDAFLRAVELSPSPQEELLALRTLANERRPFPIKQQLQDLEDEEVADLSLHDRHFRTCT